MQNVHPYTGKYIDMKNTIFWSNTSYVGDLQLEPKYTIPVSDVSNEANLSTSETNLTNDEHLNIMDNSQSTTDSQIILVQPEDFQPGHGMVLLQHPYMVQPGPHEELSSTSLEPPTPSLLDHNQQRNSPDKLPTIFFTSNN